VTNLEEEHPKRGSKRAVGNRSEPRISPADQSLEVEDRTSPGFAREMNETTARGQPGATSIAVLRGRD
jgi:hypothetical protein